MLPLLNPSDTPHAALGVQVPAPLNFKGIRGRVRDATVKLLPYERQDGNTSARESGLRFEAQVQNTLSEHLSNRYIASPILHFWDDSGPRICVPDGLFRAQRAQEGVKSIVVVEIKSQHMPEAWWQLRRLYQPIIETASAPYDVFVLEIVKSFDPSMPFPEPVRLVDDLDLYLKSPFKEFAVYRWTR